MGRLELRVPGRGRFWGRNLRISVAGTDGVLRRIAAVSPVPPAGPGEPPRGALQVLLFEPAVLTRFRLEQVARAGKPWGVAELRLFSPVDRPAASR